MIRTRAGMRSMLAWLAKNANRDSSGKLVNKPRRWPVPSFVGHISQGLEVGIETDGIGLPGNGGDDSSQCIGIGLKHFVVGKSRRHWPIPGCDEGEANPIR